MISAGDSHPDHRGTIGAASTPNTIGHAPVAVRSAASAATGSPSSAASTRPGGARRSPTPAPAASRSNAGMNARYMSRPSGL
jgi:hypothetical protein